MSPATRPRSRRPRPIACATALALAATLGATAGASPVDGTLGARINAVFSNWDHWDSPGAAVAVIQHGEMLYARGYGSAQLEYHIPITPQTPFHVASVSKQFTAMTLILLAEDGLLSLDDDVRKYVPELHDYGQTITLQHLAHHTSGLRDQWELLAMSGVRLDDVITQEHILKIVSRQRELNFPVGSEHMYSNTGYTLLAEVAARVSGKSFPELVAERIFRPLGMSRTHFHIDHEHIVSGRAYSYAPREGGWKKSVLSYANVGATSLFTTAEDLARWLDNFRTAKVGGEAGLAQLAERGTLTSGEKIDYAFGIAHGTYRGTPVLSHSGGDAGFRSFVLWAPEHELGVAVVANAADFDSGGVAQHVADEVLGDALAPREPAAEATAEETPTVVDPAVLQEYVGTYRLDIDALVTITRRDEELFASLPDGTDAAMTARSEARFDVAQNGVSVEFERTPGAPAPRFRARLGGQTFTGSRIEPIDSSRLGALVGSYYSPELDTRYRIALEDGALVAHHARQSDVVLTPVSTDELLGNQWWFGRVALERAQDGAVSGFRLSGSRVRGVRFERE